MKPKNEVPQNQLKKAASGKALLKGLVLSCVSLNEEKPGHGEPVQQSLMREIENKFREQIELKKRQLQQQQQEREQEPQPVCHKKSEEVVAKSQELKLVVVTIKESLNPLPVAGENANTSAACKVVPVESVVQKQEPNKGESETVAGETPSPIIDQSPGNDQNNKRNSICSSSSGVELRKRYSPVYERTKKMVRQSSGSINRCSTSQQKVDVALATKTNGPSSPSASLDTEGTAPVLSPVASKGELENVADAQINDVEERSIGTQGGESVKQSKDEWLGDSSVPSSHQNVKMSSSSQVGFDRSTNTLKRGASFKGIRKNIKKVSGLECYATDCSNWSVINKWSTINTCPIYRHSAHKFQHLLWRRPIRTITTCRPWWCVVWKRCGKRNFLKQKAFTDHHRRNWKFGK